MGLSKPVFKKDDWMQKDAKSRKADFDLWVRMQGEQERVNNSGCASWKQNTDSGLAAKYKPGAPAIVIVSNKFPRFIQSDGAGVLGSGGFMS